MKIDAVKKVVEDEYDIHIDSIEKIKNVYKIISKEKAFCLKIIKYDFGHFLFILSAMKYLQSKEFEKIPEIIRTKKMEDYIKLDDKHAYLMPWINARLCNYNNPVDIQIACEKLAHLHNKSIGFKVTKDMNPRIGWLRWIETYKTRKNEILDFKNRIYQKERKSEFDIFYLKVMEDELKRADIAIENLVKSDYVSKMKEEIRSKGFCHHDYAYHNILIEKKGKVNIIDFDYCILDTHLHDLSSFLIRVMKYGKWSLDTAIFILDKYNLFNVIEERDIPIMAAFMEFPQDYWQRGIQYYWEKQPWGEQFFIKKMNNYVEDREEKQEFIDKFRNIRFN